MLTARKILGVILIMSLFTSLFGCAAQKTPQYTAAEDFPPAYEKPVPEMPGKLVGVTHESSAGSMEFATEFDRCDAGADPALRILGSGP